MFDGNGTAAGDIVYEQGVPNHPGASSSTSIPVYATATPIDRRSRGGNNNFSRKDSVRSLRGFDDSETDL